MDAENATIYIVCSWSEREAVENPDKVDVVSNIMVLGFGTNVVGISVGISVGTNVVGSSVGTSVGATAGVGELETIEYGLLVEIKGFDFTMDMYELVFEKLVWGARVGATVGATDTIEYARLIVTKGFDFTMDMYELRFDE